MRKKLSEQERLEMAQAEVGQALAQTMDLYGVNPSTGMLYSILYFSDRPLTLDDLKDSMGMSKTSMSTGVRNMEKRGLVNKIWKKGSRKDYYVADTNFFNNFKNYFIPMFQREINVNMKAIRRTEPIFRELADSEDPEIRENAQSALERIQSARQYYRWLGKLVNAFETGEIFQYLPVDEPGEDQEGGFSGIMDEPGGPDEPERFHET